MIILPHAKLSLGELFWDRPGAWKSGAAGAFEDRRTGARHPPKRALPNHRKSATGAETLDFYKSRKIPVAEGE